MREQNVQNACVKKMSKMQCVKKMSKNIQHVQKSVDLFLTYFNVFENLRGKCVAKKVPESLSKTSVKHNTFARHFFTRFSYDFRPFFTRSSVLQFHVYAQVFTPHVRYFNAHLCFGLVFDAHILNIVSHMHFGHVFTPIVLATFSHSFTLTWRSRLPGCEVLALKSVMWKNPG